MNGRRARELRKVANSPIISGSVFDGITLLGRKAGKRIKRTFMKGGNKKWFYRKLKDQYKKELGGAL